MGRKRRGAAPPNAFAMSHNAVAKNQSSCAWNESIGRIRFRPMVPDFLHGAPPTDACAAFIKESRIKFVNARELDRKSGVRPTARRGRRGEHRSRGTRPGPKAVVGRFDSGKRKLAAVCC